jgi:nucleoside-diphosphate-sugar epimerase
VRLLITGSTGFVGGALLERFASDPARQVRVAVRRRVSSIPASVEQAVIGDLSSSKNLENSVRGMDAIVHAAARAHIVRAGADSLAEFRRVNVEATLNLARQAATLGVKRFVFVSSIGVNGAQTTHKPFTSDDEPAPHSPYAVSKYEAEVGLRSIAQQTGLEVVIVRPPLVIGSNAPGNFGVLMRCVYAGVPLPLRTVTNRRSFVALDNLVDFMAVCLDHPAASHQTFLVSDGEDLSTAELLRRLGEGLGKPARLFASPVALLKVSAALLGRKDVIERLCGSLSVDISRSRRLLEWAPPITAYEGIRRAAEGFLRRIESGSR